MSGPGGSAGRFALVVFDLDGVLVDTSACHAKAYADLWLHIGVAGPPYATIAGRTTRESITDCTRDRRPTTRQLEEWIGFKQRRARGYLDSEPILFPDTRPALEATLGRIGRLALGTSASRGTVDAVLRRFDLARFFTVVVTGDEVEQGKPAPDIYHRAMRDAGATPARTLVVEDSRAGLDAALASGAYSVVVRSAQRSVDSRFLGGFDDLEALVADAGVWSA